MSTKEESSRVALEESVLRELVEAAKGKLEADVTRWGPEQAGYDVEKFAETIEAAEEALEESNR